MDAEVYKDPDDETLLGIAQMRKQETVSVILQR